MRNTHSMDLDLIEAFVSVATLGGFTKASRQLHRSQPAISRRIKKLEDLLGVQLLQRRGRETALTPEGELFLQYAQVAATAVQDGIGAINDSLDPNKGGPPISVAVVGTLAGSHLANALAEFRTRYPDSPVKLQTATSREVSDLVQRGEAEIGIRYFADHRSDLEVIPVGSERLYLVANAAHKLSAKNNITPKDLIEENWLSFPVDVAVPDSFGLLLQRELVSFGISDPKITYVDSLTAQKRLVDAGYGIALLPYSSCQEELHLGSIKLLDTSVGSFAPVQPVFAIYRRSGFRRHRVDQFLSILRENMFFLETEG